MTNQKVEAARERYEALRQAAQQEFDALKEQRSGLTERMSEVKGRLEDIQLALDAFTAAPEQQEEGSAPEPQPAPEPTPSPEPAAPRTDRKNLQGLPIVDAALWVAKRRRRREVQVEQLCAWFRQAGYRTLQNKAPTAKRVTGALCREHRLDSGRVTRVAHGVYRLNW